MEQLFLFPVLSAQPHLLLLFKRSCPNFLGICCQWGNTWCTLYVCVQWPKSLTRVLYFVLILSQCFFVLIRVFIYKSVPPINLYEIIVSNVVSRIWNLIKQLPSSLCSKCNHISWFISHHESYLLFTFIGEHFWCLWDVLHLFFLSCSVCFLVTEIGIISISRIAPLILSINTRLLFSAHSRQLNSPITSEILIRVTVIL